MNFYIDIEKKQIMKEATKMTIKVSNIELNSSAIIKIELYDNIYNLLDTNQIILDGIDYQNWNNDDWLLDFISDKYGYKIIIKNI